MDAKGAGEPDPLDFAIGVRIRTRRLFLGMSQTDLADKIDVSFQQVQRYERGVSRVPASKLVAIAAAMGTKVRVLVGETDDETSETAVFDALAEPGAMEMLRAWSAVSEPKARAALLALAQDLAQSEGRH